jgi:hypothetical protein
MRNFFEIIVTLFFLALAIIGAKISYNVWHSYVIAFFVGWGLMGVFYVLSHIIERLTPAKREKEKQPEKRSKPQKTNILKIENGSYGNMAYFDKGIVYQAIQNSSKEIKIGRYSPDGKVFDSDGYEIGQIHDDLIMLTRLGDMQRLRESLFGKSDERSLTPEEQEKYYPIARGVTLCWNCAEAKEWGGISDFKNFDTVAEPVTSTDREGLNMSAAHQKILPKWEDPSYKLGFGACFVCLAYINRKSSKYGSFYCEIGETFVEP